MTDPEHTDPTAIRIERTFAAPANEVFEAWTSAELLRRWYPPGADWDTPVAEVDLRIGGRLRLWDFVSGREARVLEGHSQTINAVTLSADHKTALSGSLDGTAKQWDAGTGRERATLRGHTQGVHTVAFAPDGREVATGSHDTTIKLWELRTDRP